MSGELDVRALMRRTTAKRFSGWERYFESLREKELRLEYAAALVASTIANVNRGADQRAYTVDDFLLKIEEKVAEPLWKRQMTVAQMIWAAYSATDEEM